MFNKKYKKVLELLEKKIETTNQLFYQHLTESSNIKKLSDKDIYDNAMIRGGQGWQTDKYLAKLEALCELKREIEKAIDL